MPRATWSRIASCGRPTPAISASVSSRRRASSGELACKVESAPSWPVFSAVRRSSASAPRTSPITIRSGRIRSALRRRSRIVTSPLPSTDGRPALEPDDVRLAQAKLGRVLDRDHPLGRVDPGGHRVQQRGLPGARAAGDQHRPPAVGPPPRGSPRQPAPPTRLRPARPARAARRRTAGSRSPARRPRAAARRRSRASRPRGRASAIGESSSTRRPVGAEDPLDRLAHRVLRTRTAHRRRLDPPGALDVDAVVAPLTMTSSTRGRRGGPRAARGRRSRAGPARPARRAAPARARRPRARPARSRRRARSAPSRPAAASARRSSASCARSRSTRAAVFRRTASITPKRAWRRLSLPGRQARWRASGGRRRRGSAVPPPRGPAAAAARREPRARRGSGACPATAAGPRLSPSSATPRTTATAGFT